MLSKSTWTHIHQPKILVKLELSIRLIGIQGTLLIPINAAKSFVSLTEFVNRNASSSSGTICKDEKSEDRPKNNRTSAIQFDMRAWVRGATSVGEERRDKSSKSHFGDIIELSD